jgi:hypothetical protein
MTDSIYAWSTTPADNGNADASINFAEYQPPSSVNDSNRAMMARLAAWLKDISASVATTGGGNAYVVTSAAMGGGASLRDGETIEVIVHAANTGACTLNRDGKGAVPWRPKSGTEFRANSLQSGVPYKATYKQATNEWISNVPAYAIYDIAPSLFTSNTFGLKVGDVKLSLATTPDAGFIRLTEAVQNLVKADYPDLNSWAGGQGYPWGSTSTTFGIPPAGGHFLRFGSSNSTVDPDGPRTPGTTQADAIKTHTHTGTTSTQSAVTMGMRLGSAANGTGVGFLTPATSGTYSSGVVADVPAHNHTFTTDATGGTETRGKNVTMFADMLAVPALVASGLIGAGGFAYKFNSATSSADPGAGYFALNNATVASATALYISETDANGASLATVLAAITSNSQIYVTKVGSPANFIAFTLSSSATDNGAWNTFTISDASATGTIGNNDAVSIVVMRAGATGAASTVPGPAGPNVGLDYTWSTSTSGDPGSGKILVNNATLASATQINISETNRLGASQATYIATWDDSTNATKGTIRILDVSAPGTNFVEYEITGSETDAGAYDTFTVTNGRSAGTLANGTNVAVVFFAAGNKGADGTGAGDTSTNTSTSVVSEVVLFADTSGKVLKRATGSGLAKLTSGVLSTATANTDYLTPPSGTSLLKAGSGGALANATPGADYLVPPSGTSLLKANGGGALANAVSGGDFCPATSGSSVLKGSSGGTAPATAGTGGDFVAPGTQTSFTQQQGFGIATLTDGASIAWDVSTAQSAQVTLGGSRTMSAVTNAVAGFVYTLVVVQDGSGSRLLTWTTSGAGAFDFGADGAPTLTTTASKADILSFLAVSIGGTLKLRYCGIKKGFA